MSRVKFTFLLLLLTFAVFFSLEQSSIWPKANQGVRTIFLAVSVLAVFTAFLIPALHRPPAYVTAVFWPGVFLAGQVFLRTDRVPGSDYAFALFIELGFVALVASLAQGLASSLGEVESATRVAALAAAKRPIPAIDRSDDLIRAELTRSRHYQRDLSLVVIEPPTNMGEPNILRLLREMEKAITKRYAEARIIQIVRRELRAMDILLEDTQASRLVLLCPELDRSEAARISEHLKSVVLNELNLNINFSLASFPQDGLTFNALLQTAVEKLPGSSHKSNGADFLKSEAFPPSESEAGGEI